MPWCEPSRIAGVRAPLIRDLGGEPERGVSRGGEVESGDVDSGLETSLTVLDPLVATMDGEVGGSGERVKYTTFASDPPISTAMCDTGST